MPLASFVHLIGSVPADNAEQAMRTVCENLPGRIYRISDGETGVRNMFAIWQARKIWPTEVLAHRPEWNNVPTPGSLPPKKFDLKKEHLPSTTGYAEHALSSYEVFCRLRDSGVIPPGVKFQVCLPSPTTVVGMMVHQDYQVEAEKLYEQLLYADLALVQNTVPHQDLAIQWDVLAEVGFLERAYGKFKVDNWLFGQLRPFFKPVREGIESRMARLAKAVNGDVEMGFHFCYGDSGEKHFVQPGDAGFLAELVSIALKIMTPLHRVGWVHIPVPRDRTDEAYIDPLKGLEFGDTKLVLGLVHKYDTQGTKERLETARRLLPGVEFGISTECGLGRKTREDLSSVFQILRDNAEVH